MGRLNYQLSGIWTTWVPDSNSNDLLLASDDFAVKIYGIEFCYKNMFFC